ncbi:DUF4255 domain-containing protein [Nonomuraea sediminis]|uniref:DUF4255 domain-containing protein n=1 Tax=Nonomuraea sediminis TaxID=2835864 RepID=UPI001BDD1BB0|nr:DUF4255 domain-containing protein [Nonomuraea sediminis]
MSKQDGVIGEVDDALRELIRREALARSKAEVLLSAPGAEPAAEGEAPAVHLRLYDIREDLGRRRQGTINEVNADGAVTARRRPPRYLSLSYLVTVRAPEPEEEHRLLSAILRALLAHDTIPADRLTGSLAELGLPVTMAAACPPREDRTLEAAAGPRPFVNVVVSAPITPDSPAPVAPPVREPLGVRAEERHSPEGLG